MMSIWNRIVQFLANPRTIFLRGVARYSPAPPGTPLVPDLDSAAAPLDAAFAAGWVVTPNGGQLASLGGDYWTETAFALGTAYAFDAGQWYIGPFVIDQPTLTLRGAVRPSTQLRAEVLVYSPQSLVPPYRPPSAASDQRGADSTEPQRASTSTPSTTAPGSQLSAPRSYRDSLGREIPTGWAPYCIETEITAIELDSCGPWRQLSFDVSGFGTTAAYLRLTVTGDGPAYLNYLKLTDTAVQADNPSWTLNTDDPPAPLWGLADLHTHPLAHIGMGGVISPPFDPSSHDPADLGVECTHIDAGANPVIDAIPDAHLNGSGGTPYYTGFPMFTGGVHTQMHPAWIRRAWEGGLRLMVALAVTDEAMELAYTATGVLADGHAEFHYNEMDRIREVIDGFDTLVANNSEWMAHASSPADARSIIASGKLAIVYGLEVDRFLGRWMNAAELGADGPAEEAIRTQLQTLYDLGIRQINPVHLSNNAFGGCSIYNDYFNLNNLVENWAWYTVETAGTDLEASLGGDPTATIEFRLSNVRPPAGLTTDLTIAQALFPLTAAVVATIEADVPAPPDYESGVDPRAPVPPRHGHQNHQGSTTLMTLALELMMRLGLLIDVDHMGAKTTDAVLSQCEARAEPYPVISAHSTFRALCPRRNWGDERRPGPGQRATHDCWAHESAKPDSTARRILGLGGMMAPITTMLDVLPDTLLEPHSPVAADSSGSSRSYAQQLRHAVALAGGRGTGIGTDMVMLNQVGPRFGPLAAFGLVDDAPEAQLERTRGTIGQENGVAYRPDQPRSGYDRFPLEVNPTRANPYQQVGVPPEDAIGPEGDAFEESIFATNVWKALWRHEAGIAPDPVDDPHDLTDILIGFNTASADATRLHGLQRVAYEALNGVPYSAEAAGISPARLATLTACLRGWRNMQGTNEPLERPVTGSYTFDFNVDGLAHYGLIPDLMQDLKNIGVGFTTLNALFSSAEQYIRTWERCEALSDFGRESSRRRSEGASVGLRP